MSRGYAIAVILLTCVLLVGAVAANAIYTRHVQQQADRRWCALLGTLDNPSVPTTTERGHVVQRQIHTLRVQLECRP